MRRMEVTQVFPGSFFVTDGENSLLAGCPPEIVKVLRQRELAAPRFVLLPDVPVSRGESQVAVEFPLYHHQFLGRGTRGETMVLLGSESRVSAAKKLLEISLYGPDEVTSIAWGLTPQEAESMGREWRWFQVKDKNGRALTLNQLVEEKPVRDTAETDLGWLRVRRVASNVFELSAGDWRHILDLNLAEEQAPPYPVRPDLTVSSLVKMGVEVLGGATGFSATQPCSGLALCYNGNYLLLDAIPYLNHHLRARGIARNQVHSLFLTHIHDDHCNLVSLLQYNRRIEVLTTPLIFRLAMRKLALTTDRSEESLREYFGFRALTPGKETDHYGLRITPFWASHSVPTIGAQFVTHHNGVDYTMLHTADTQALSDIKRMQRSGVITLERYNAVADVYQKPAHLLIADGGEGSIHGDPADAINSPAERIVFLHLDDLSEKFNAQFSLATSGKRYPIVKGDTDYNLTRTIEFLMEYFPGMPPIWISNLLANQSVHTFNAGDIIIRQGSRSEGYVYMILTGYAQVVLHDGERKQLLAQMEAGELIGEMSVITGKGQRNASVVALSPVTVTAFSEDAFRGFIRQQQSEQRLRTMWQNRELLSGFTSLRQLQQPVIRTLSETVALEHLPARGGRVALAEITPPGGLIFPLGRDVVIERSGRRETIPANSRPLYCDISTAVIADTELPYLVLNPQDAAALRRRIPAFRFFWEETLGLPVPKERDTEG
jgi:CRP-like cAMP-binding protein